MRATVLLFLLLLGGHPLPRPVAPPPEWFRWEANGINDSGVIVGTRLVLKSDSLRYGYSAFILRPGATPRYFGTLGGRQSKGLAINTAGRVAGTSQTRAGAWHAFVFVPGTGMRDLGTLPGDAASEATGINDAGDVVGWSATGADVRHAFLWSAAGGMRPLGALPGHSYSQANAINRSGLVIGYSASNNSDGRAFLYTPGAGLRDLGALPGDVTAQALGINSAGDMVGVSADSSHHQRAVLWTAAGGLRELATVMGEGGAGSAYAAAINDAGQIGAEVPVAELYHTTAVIFTPGAGTRQLGNLELQRGIPLAINRSGHMVGNATFDGQGYGRAFLYTPEGGMRDLTELWARARP